MTPLLLAFAAAGSFTAGGLLMKPAEGLSRLVPSLAMFALFVVGAAFTALLVHRGGEVGPAYLVVVGLESVLAFFFSAGVFGEQITPSRLVAVGLLLGGTVLLAHSGA